MTIQRLAGYTGLAALVLATGSAAIAEEAVGKKNQLEEIVVTARRRIESLQDVPISVNVVSGNALDLAQENELSRLSKFVPSFRFVDSGSDVARSITIRGVGTNTFSRGVEQSVGTAIDGVVSDTLAASLLDFGDVENIQVLNGPQGMLFGKNASAGLINITTRRPTWDFEAGLNTSWADGNEIKVSGFLSGPLSDTLAGRISFFRNKQDPYIKNLAGRDHNDRDEWALRSKFEWRPIDELNVLFTYAHSERSPLCCGSPAVEVAEGGIADLAGTPTGPHNDTINNAAESNNVTRLNTYILDANWEIGDYTLSSISAYTDGYAGADVRLIFPFPSETFLNPNVAVSDTALITQELRLTSPAGEFLEWIAGAYYYDKRESFELKRNTDAFYLAPPAPGRAPGQSGFSLTNSVRYLNTSVALFGNLTFNLTDRASITAGARWNYDDVRFRQAVGFNPDVFPNTLPEAAIQENPSTVDARRDDHGISWRVSGQFDVTEDAMAYASAGQGYKGPAANTLTTGFRAIEPIIDPEIPTSFEVGVKSEWFDRRLRLNTSVFFTQFRDFQAAATRIDPITENLGFFLANAERLDTHGVELDIVGQPLPNLTLNFVAAYIDATFGKYTGAPCYQGQTADTGCIEDQPGDVAQDLSGVQLGQSPDWSFTVGGNYWIPITPDVNAFALGSYNWQDTMLAGLTGSPRTRIDSYGLMDLNLGLNGFDGRYSIQVFAKNLFDTFYETGAIPLDVVGINRAHTLAYTYKRRVGVAVSLRF